MKDEAIRAAVEASPECANGCAAPMACSGPDKCALSAPKMPDDYWLHVRGCDCDYCTWERRAAMSTEEKKG